jgi:superoxide dismutase, Cu-Zn family
MKGALTIGLFLLTSISVQAKTASVTINKIDETGVAGMIGILQLEDTQQGLRITPSLNGLPPGPHGFHVHSKSDCGPAEDKGKPAAGMAAGGHLDPKNTGKHLGPESTEGHQGDLPVLMVDDKGSAQTPVVAPHLKVDDVIGHSFMIHAGGDNYSDQPAPLGGGGARIACGKLQAP